MYLLGSVVLRSPSSATSSDQELAFVLTKGLPSKLAPCASDAQLATVTKRAQSVQLDSGHGVLAPGTDIGALSSLRALSIALSSLSTSAAEIYLQLNGGGLFDNVYVYII